MTELFAEIARNLKDVFFALVDYLKIVSKLSR